MVLTEAEGLLMLAAADLETAEASSDPLIFREGPAGQGARHQPMRG